jgi:uncharacterized protein YjdB
MKRLLFIVPIVLCSVVSANTYYVATNGNDNYTSTQAQNINTPWASWRKGIEFMKPGDILYIRGGTYRPSNSDKFDASNYAFVTNIVGTASSPISIYAYPADYESGNFPVLDCSDLLPNPSSGGNGAISLYRCRFYRFKGLTICNLHQSQTFGVKISSFTAYECDNLYFEACTVHDTEGPGFYVLNYNAITPSLRDSTYFINCDSYNNCDKYAKDGNGNPNYGNGADGFFVQQTDSPVGNYGLFDGCRAWHNSDDQFNFDQSCLTVARNCWAFNGGWPEFAKSEGNGFKIGDPPPHSPDYISRITYYCIAANNIGFGFDPNNALGGEWPRAHTYNNLSYHNKVGYIVQNVAEAPLAANMNIYRNNISYLDSDYPFEDVPALQGNTAYVYTEDHNTWRKKSNTPYWENNPIYSVSTADFVSLDVSELTRPRKSDGSLPDVDFAKLTSNSDLINTGIDVGLPYVGTAPDLGPFEYSVTDPNFIPVTSITVTGQGGSASITTDNGTLQLSAAILPANATNKTVTWSISSGSDKAGISATGLVTALDNGTTIARATAKDGSGVFGTLTITISNQVVPVTGITVTGAGGATAINIDNGTLQLSAAILPTNATNKTVTWSVANGTGQASISGTGLVTAIANGTVTARATANDGSAVYGTLLITISNQVIPVTGITVTGAGGATTIVTDNGTLQLNAAVTPLNATNQTVTWSITSGTGIASVSSGGLVTALDNGTATIRATANDGSGVYGTLLITISNQIIPVSGITITGAGGATLISVIGGTLQLSAAILPSNATNKSVTWSISSGADKASISPGGLVTALDNGTATARATANDGSGIFGTLIITISNQIIPVTAIAVTGAGGATTITTDNGTLQLSAAISPSNATTQTVTWSISNGTGEASISAGGLVTALANGTVTATATANDGSGVSGSLVLTLSNQIVPVAGISVTGAGGATTITTYNGTLQLSAVITPASATNKTVTWSIINGTGSASISTSGLVTALANGTVTATATANDGSGVSGSLVITLSNQTVHVTGITVTGAGGATTISTANGTLQLSAAITPASATNKSVTWSIVNGTGVASISTSGLVTAIANGTVTATATANDGSGVSGSLVLTLSKQIVSVTGITVTGANGATTITTENGTLQLSARITPANATTQTVTWSISNDTGEALIDGSGLVSAISNGTVTAMATADDGSGIFGTLVINISFSTDSTGYNNLPVKVYPNPANEFITVRIDKTDLAPEFLQLINLSGIVLLKFIIDPDVSEFTIPLNLKTGVYIVQIGDSGNTTLFTQKLIVRK